MFGKEVLEPRQIAYMADTPNLSYTYSRMKMMPAQWHPEVEYLKVLDVSSSWLTSVGVHCYRLLH